MGWEAPDELCRRCQGETSVTAFAISESKCAMTARGISLQALCPKWCFTSRELLAQESWCVRFLTAAVDGVEYTALAS